MKRKNGFISNHIKDNKPVYIIEALLFMGSFVFGVFYSRLYANPDVNALDSMMQILKSNTSNPFGIYLHSLLSHLKLVCFLWLFGITFLGPLAGAGIIIYRGFSVGFTMGLLVKLYYLKGLTVSALYILPQVILTLPVYFFICLCVFKTNKIFYYTNKRKSHRIKETNFNLFKYSAYFFLSAVYLFAVALLDGYVFPYLVNFVFNLMD